VNAARAKRARVRARGRAEGRGEEGGRKARRLVAKRINRLELHSQALDDKHLENHRQPSSRSSEGGRATDRRNRTDLVHHHLIIPITLPELLLVSSARSAVRSPHALPPPSLAPSFTPSLTPSLPPSLPPSPPPSLPPSQLRPFSEGTHLRLQQPRHINHHLHSRPL
jgi:hypothetical protein